MASHRWLKISDPETQPPELADGVDVRALISADRSLDPIAGKLESLGAAVRRVPHLLEDEEIAVTDGTVRAESRECHTTRPRGKVRSRSSGPAARAAHDAFDALWQAETAHRTPTANTPVSDLVPAEWVGYYPHPALNPAQQQAIPEIVGSDDNLLIVAPTGAGKTVMGMTAALHAILGQKRKAAWLVPQRSLTDELDRDLDLWRRHGLRVERLSGEHRLDIARLKAADLWVATTEKFESICRAISLREVLNEVGALIVDEVHLLGDAVRGPVLEAMLARMRDPTGPARLIGLSATVTNRAEIAAWLHARLVTIAWRPGRLTWQLPIIAGHQDWNVTEAARTRLAAAITADVTADGGSVLVFCGSKRNVRLTALVIAAARGADVRRVRVDDADQVHEVCRRAGVGLHYKGWEHRAAAEDDFRQRRLDVLVATTTVAAGVNLPARAVIVRDTQVGFGSLDVATVLQMFGRAGRAGTGEENGWAFLIVDEHEHALWRQQLMSGYRVDSRIQAGLVEQVLSAAVQHRITSQPEAEQWWVQTLAHHQGSRRLTPLHTATSFLRDAEMVRSVEEQPGQFAATDLGRLTSRLMIEPTVGDELRRALAELDFPGSPQEAERLLIRTLATTVPKLAQAIATEAVRPAVAKLLGAPPPAAGGVSLVLGGAPGDLAQASLLAYTGSEPLAAEQHLVAGIPHSAMYPILENAPRYLHWLGSQGQLGTVHPWCAVVAADLGRRVRWRRLGPPRGAGRLLWMLEQMADPGRIDTDLPALWTAAVARGHTDPDWPAGRAPAGCALDVQAYSALLRDRATDCRINEYPPHAWVTNAPPGTVVAWKGSRWRATPARRGAAEAPYPEHSGEPRGTAVFTWRGDHRATGWLAAYNTAVFQQTGSRGTAPREPADRRR
jgi:helicase